MSEAASQPTAERNPSLLRNLSFQLLWISAATASFGDRMIELAAIPMLMAVGTQESAGGPATSAVYFWYFLPWVIITPIGGWLADTLPRKWILLACDEVRAGLLLVAVLLIPAGMTTAQITGHVPPERHYQIYLILLGVGTAAAIFSPTRNALVPQLVGQRQLNSANAIVLGIGVVASLLGYMGGKIMERWSVGAGISVAVAGFAISGLFFIFMRPRVHSGLDTDRQASELTRMLRAGSYIRRHKPVRELILLYAAVWSMAFIVAPAIASLCLVNYHIPRADLVWPFSLMNMSLGAGMLVAGLAMAVLNVRREAPVMMLAGMFLAGLCLIPLALSRTHTQGMILCFGIGLFGGVAMISVATLTQAITANYILGRVTGLREVVSNLICVVINLAIWQLPEIRKVNPHIPEPDPILVGTLYPLAAVMMGIALWCLWRFIRRGPHADSLANVLWRIDRLVVTSWHRLQWRGTANVPRTGPVIIAANHTAGLDPFLIQAVLPRMVSWVMLTDYKYRLLWPMWSRMRPIALEDGTHNLTEIRQIMRRLEAGDAVGLFPEGGLQRTKRELQPFQRGIGLIAKRTGATIVPVWISGTPRAQSMALHFLVPSRSKVVFGKAYKPDATMNHEEITEDLRRRMIELAGE